MPVPRCTEVSQPMSLLGHSRPMHLVPVPINDRCYSNSDIIVRRIEVTLRAITGSQRRHSITLSARANNVSGIFRPKVFAVVRLITSSKLVGCSIGRSFGLAPRRTFASKRAA